MYRTLTLRLHPSREQEVQFMNYAGATRFIWNKLLDFQYNSLADNAQLLDNFDMGKLIVWLKRQSDTCWLSEISHHTLLSVSRDITLAFRLYRSGFNGRPRYKSRKHSKISFYSRPDRFYFQGNMVHLDKLGFIQISSSDYKLPDRTWRPKINRVTVQYRNNKWVLLISYACESQTSEPKTGVMGIDVGVHTLVTAYQDSSVKQFYSMLHNVGYRRANYRLRCLNSRVTQKFKYHVNGTAISNRLQQYLDMVKRAYLRQHWRRLNNMRGITASLLSSCPSCVVIETLNVHQMQEDAKTSRYMFESSLALMLAVIKSVCERRGIPLKQASASFPSSQLCSSCGNRSKLSLSDRLYRCSACGLVLDRDINAAKNLSMLA